MLFKLSLKNVRKSLKDYAVYFATLTVGVAVFYVFNAVETQAVMLNVMQKNADFTKILSGMLSGVSVLVSLILGFLVIYASRFLMKRRKKEFGTYLLLGLGKWKVSMILFWETLLIGGCSLAVGLLTGVVLSQFMSLFVANLFAADMTVFRFLFSRTACEKTIIHFVIIYLVLLLFQTFEIGKCRLITFFHAKGKSEEIKMRKPWICIVVFTIAAGMLAFAYYQVTGNVENLHSTKEIFSLIIMGIVSTFLIFWSVSGLAFKLVSLFEKYYYKGLHAFIFRQLASRINTTVCVMSVISLMLFLTICVLSCSLSVKNSMDSMQEQLTPVDIVIHKRISLEDGETEQIVTDALGLSSSFYNEYTKEQLEGLPLSIKEVYGEMEIDLSRYFSREENFYIYRIPKITIGDLFKEVGKDMSESEAWFYMDKALRFVKVSDYNRLMSLFGKEKVKLSADEYMVIANLPDMVKEWELLLQVDLPLTVSQNTLYPADNRCRTGFLDMAANYNEYGFIVVPDEAVSALTPVYEYLAANYNTKSKEEKKEIEKIVTRSDVYEYPESYSTWMSINTKIDVVDAGMGIGGIITFLGLYLGIVFLLSSAVVLALKELSEYADNIERYQILRRLGTDEKIINRTLLGQIGIFFGTPLILALVHSVFGISFLLYQLRTFGREGLLSSVLETIAVLLVIYGGYFALTYACSKNIIKDRMVS